MLFYRYYGQELKGDLADFFHNVDSEISFAANGTQLEFNHREMFWLNNLHMTLYRAPLLIPEPPARRMVSFESSTTTLGHSGDVLRPRHPVSIRPDHSRKDHARGLRSADFCSNS